MKHTNNILKTYTKYLVVP